MNKKKPTKGLNNYNILQPLLEWSLTTLFLLNLHVLGAVLSVGNDGTVACACLPNRRVEPRITTWLVVLQEPQVILPLAAAQHLRQGGLAM